MTGGAPPARTRRGRARTRRPPVGRLAAAGMAAAALLAAGCGLQAPPRPPEDTAPVIPAPATVERDGDDLVVRWKRAERSADGKRLDDLAAFEVEKKTAPGDAWHKVATIDVIDQEKFRRRQDWSWADHEPGDAAAYRVRAVCADGQQGPPRLARDDEAPVPASPQAE